MVAWRIKPTKDSISLNLQRPNEVTRKKESEREEDTGFPSVAVFEVKQEIDLLKWKKKHARKRKNVKATEVRYENSGQACLYSE